MAQDVGTAGLDREKLLAMDEAEFQDLVSQRFRAVLGREADPSEFAEAAQTAPAPEQVVDPAPPVGEGQPPAGLETATEETEVGNPFTGEARTAAARAGIARQQMARAQGNIRDPNEVA
tara:strand:+ start:5704 stop:6060 length:357 start_codon:yes stop_codon:yes gene_type:complete